MAIINLTPDSFYAKSRNEDLESARSAIDRAVAEGATIVDIGGYSSRPGAAEVSVDEEWRRVRMGLEAVCSMDEGVVVSIDTFRSEIVRRAVEEFGDVIVNDISAGELDADMAATVARLDLCYIAMHMRGTPQTMQQMTKYEGGVVGEVVGYFRRRVEELQEAGIAPERIILDPGFGFAKSTEQNFELLRGLDNIRALGYPILVGLSRKSMIYRSLGISAEESLPGSLALAWQTLQGGNAILRVHDVGATQQVVRLSNIYRTSIIADDKAL
ncbi:MAG: dihydropteroate synthase [Rikenellaceae bacterium]|nr:dihydropteroate synthase [Rikenellaceae bacterium]